MNIVKCVLVYLVLALGVFTVSISQPQKSEKHPSKQQIVLDNFDRDPIVKPHKTFTLHQTSHGYGVYYDKATLELSKVAVSKSDSALQIEYTLPVVHDWGNWLSIRCELDPIVNLKKFTGLKLKLKVVNPSNAMLRVTIADVENAKNREEDELWWYDLSDDVLSQKEGQWQTLTIPFKKFFISYGAGTRQNDGKLDLSKIVAYEFNILTKGSVSAKGSIIVNSLTTY